MKLVELVLKNLVHLNLTYASQPEAPKAGNLGKTSKKGENFKN